MNISNNLKQKVIAHRQLTEEEIDKFLNYIIHKSIVITNHMYNNKNYSSMFLLYEICHAYNLTLNPYNKENKYYAIINISNKDYLIDINFNNNKIKKLAENKYIEYNDKIYKLYLQINKEESNE